MVGKSKKMKVSKLKHSNQVITKLKKQGKIKSQRHRKKKISIKPAQKPVINYSKEVHSDDDDSIQGSDMMDMMEEDDLNYLLKSTASSSGKKSKGKLTVEGNTSELEEEYESKLTPVEQQKRQKQLLPIKTKHGIEMRSIDMDEIKSSRPAKKQKTLPKEDELEKIQTDTEEHFADDENTALDTNKPLSATDLLFARQEDLQNKKIKIGVLCSGILENPEIKLNNFLPLLYLMDEKSKIGHENLLTIRKLSTVSLLEVFKDILPDYQISQQDFGDVKLKKETLALTKYEAGLLAHYKRYLQRLEKMASILVKKKGDNRKFDQPRLKLGHLAVTCLCDLLVSHPYFNFSSNLVQMLVPYLNHKNSDIRTLVSECFKNVFKNDKKGLMSLTVVRKINQLVKTRSNDVHCEVLNCMLALKIKDVNLDDEKKLEMKQKKQMSHKQRLISMSKKERKRDKKLKELEKEMLETKAEESKQTKQQNLTEIIKVVFMIYFRILKRSPNSKLLSATLEGLSKFAHIMNLEYYSDLVNLLNNLLENEDLGYREQLHCVQTVFAVLSGQGDVLNIDPTRFYSHLYRNLLNIHSGKNHSDLIIILKALTNVLIMRRKKVSQQITLAFLKRTATLSTQVLHNGALGCLGVIKTVMQHSKQSEILLELDQELGSGQYDPYLMEPEYCNATSTALYELTLLRKHYHPTVKVMASNIINGLPATGEGSLPVDIGKLSPEQLFENFDSSKMAFKPAIPPPKKVQHKSKRNRRHIFTNPNFEDYCKAVANQKIRGTFDFSEIVNK